MFVNKKFKKIFTSVLIVLSSLSLFAEAGGSGVERFALYIGCNNGGKSNARLMYAGTDASSFQKTMSEIGGVPNSNSILLIDPTKDDVDNALDAITDAIARNSNASRRSEFIFYYSGHSSETALLLGKTSYEYTILKESISKVPSDVHVVILDSCYSGNFIRTKGGSRQKPFLVDDSTVVKGHAYLSSSSSQEASQESDEIGSSFFTNAVLTGLRGAADSTGDKKVTLNELYSYAFNETLSKTESSASGPQHPNYNITLVGSGDLVLSDISTSECLVKVSKETDGRVIIRNNAGKLISEVNKTYGSPVYLALERGRYSATVITADNTYQGNFELSPNKVYVVETKNLSAINRVANRTRGNSDDDSNSENLADGNVDVASVVEVPEDEILYYPFNFSVVCNETTMWTKKAIVTTIGLGLIRSSVYGVKGVQLSAITNNSDFVTGVQATGVFNIAKDLKGAQASGVFNIAQNVLGIQATGVFNIAQNVNGAQGSGVFNIADDMKGVQGSGVFNVARGIIGAQGTGTVNVARDLVGVQGAGLGNFVLKNMKGVQGAGLLNIACGNAVGVQAAGLFNYAHNVKGAQIGLFNICKGNCDGIQIGLINVSKNGVLEIGASYTTENDLRFTFNTGTRYLYAILGYSAALKCLDSRVDVSEKYGHILMGIGSRVKFAAFNIDFEVIGNEILNGDFVKVKDEDKEFTVQKTYWYPSFRVGFGFTPVKHFQLFAGAMMSFEFEGNNDAFRKKTNNFVIETKDPKVKFHPEFDFGLRFSFN